MSLVPRARHKWAWWRRQWTYCQKPYLQGNGRTLEIKWQCRIKELNHPWGSDIPGFLTTPARGTGEDLEWVPTEVSPPVPTHWGKTCKIGCGSAKNHGPCNFVSCCTLYFSACFPVWNLDWKITVELLWLQHFSYSSSLHRSITPACHFQVAVIRKENNCLL